MIVWKPSSKLLGHAPCCCNNLLLDSVEWTTALPWEYRLVGSSVLGVISKKQGQYEVPVCVVLARQVPLAGDDGVFIGFRVAGHIVEELKYEQLPYHIAIHS